MRRVSLPFARSVPKAVGVKKRADAGARGADALGERALRHQLELDLARAIERLSKCHESAWRGNEQRILRTRFAFDQRGEAGVAVAGVVVDDGEVARALRDQRIDQRGRHAGVAEAADHDRGAVGHVGQRRFGAGEEFVDHRGRQLWHPALPLLLSNLHSDALYASY